MDAPVNHLQISLTRVEQAYAAFGTLSSRSDYSSGYPPVWWG